MKASVSIIISTQNRAASLEQTLRAFDAVNIPSGWDVELIVVDNASTDRTAEVTRSSRLQNVKVQYLFESRKGKSHALNAALAVARGEAFLFTDDDVVPTADWLEKIAAPLLQRACDGTMGQIQLAKHLSRPWLSRDHLWSLAVSGSPATPATELVGANMGLHRSVFQRIPGFDPELGPGASGFGEETLLTWQMQEAGLRLQAVPDAIVVHHPDVSRLVRAEWLKGAHKRGRSLAYLLYHWQHTELKWPGLRYYYLSAKLHLRRRLQPPPPPEAEGCPQWEMSYLAEMALCRHYTEERQRPRNYSRHGLGKNS